MLHYPSKNRSQLQEAAIKEIIKRHFKLEKMGIVAVRASFHSKQVLKSLNLIEIFFYKCFCRCVSCSEAQAITSEILVSNLETVDLDK